MVAAAAGVRCFIAMPDDAAVEKSQMLEALGGSFAASARTARLLANAGGIPASQRMIWGPRWFGRGYGRSRPDFGG